MDDFLAFVAERHRIWEKRQAGAPQPWTDDPVLATRKFTNVFRVLDPGTQFLLTDLFDAEADPRENLLRAFLYRYTGRPEVWQYLDLTVGLPTAENLDEVEQALKDYRAVDLVPGKTDTNQDTIQRKAARPIFTGAYFVPTPAGEVGVDKLDNLMNITREAFTPGTSTDIMPAWEKAQTQAQRYRALRGSRGVGDFMAMQILTDWGYQCGEDREDEFLVPGPGSIKGAKALGPQSKTMEVVHRAVREIQALADCPRLGYRTPSLMDIGSNLLCEWSKYVRYRGQAAPSKTYQPAHPGPQPEPVLPGYYTEDLI